MNTSPCLLRNVGFRTTYAVAAPPPSPCRPPCLAVGRQLGCAPCSDRSDDACWGTRARSTKPQSSRLVLRRLPTAATGSPHHRRPCIGSPDRRRHSRSATPNPSEGPATAGADPAAAAASGPAAAAGLAAAVGGRSSSRPRRRCHRQPVSAMQTPSHRGWQRLRVVPRCRRRRPSTATAAQTAMQWTRHSSLQAVMVISPGTDAACRRSRTRKKTPGRRRQRCSESAGPSRKPCRS